MAMTDAPSWPDVIYSMGPHPSRRGLVDVPFEAYENDPFCDGEWYKQYIRDDVAEEEYKRGLERAAEILERLIADEHFGEFDDERDKGRCFAMVQCLGAIRAEIEKIE